MGNTTSSTSSRKHQKRTSSPRNVKPVKKSPFSFGSKKRAPVAKKTGRNNRNTKFAKKNDATTLVKKYGPIAWTKAKASGVGPFKKQGPPSKKAGLLSKLVSTSEKR